MAVTQDHRFEFGAVVISDDDRAEITTIWAGSFGAPYWKSRANDESRVHFWRRIIGEARRHGPALLHLTRERYEEICRRIEDDDG
jgi:hypothetical protein